MVNFQIYFDPKNCEVPNAGHDFESPVMLQKLGEIEYRHVTQEFNLPLPGCHISMTSLVRDNARAALIYTFSRYSTYILRDRISTDFFLFQVDKSSTKTKFLPHLI